LLEDSVADNIVLASLPRLARRGMRRKHAERELARHQTRALSIRATSIEQQTLLLSGGNQQKVVLAKWLAREPKVLILDEPTRGIDVGAKSEIYALIFELAARGVGILLISSELEELIGACDRVIVMHEGAIQGELPRDQLTEQNILALAVGSQT
jgi:ribose transport system ATP-binding protein